MGKIAVSVAFAVALSTAVSCWTSSVLAQAGGYAYAGSREAVLRLVDLVPRPWRSGPRPIPPIGYVDLEAVVRTAVPGATMATLSPDQISAALARISIGPRSYLDRLPDDAERMPEMIGIGVGDVHRVLEFGGEAAVPWGVMLGLAPQQDHGPAIASALDGRDFERRTIDGVPLWHRRDYSRGDRRSRDPSDPFGNDLGRAARIAYLDGVLVGSPYWQVAEGMVAAANGGPAVTRDAGIEAAVYAVTDPTLEGALLQLQVLDHWDPRLLPAPQAAARGAFQPLVSNRDLMAGERPVYWSTALADRSTGDRDEVLVALIYQGARSAETAAAVLGERFRTFELPGMPGAWTTLLADLNATISSEVVRVGNHGHYRAALVRISHPTQATADEDGGVNQPGAVFRFLVDALAQNALTPLMSEPSR